MGNVTHTPCGLSIALSRNAGTAASKAKHSKARQAARACVCLSVVGIGSEEKRRASWNLHVYRDDATPPHPLLPCSYPLPRSPVSAPSPRYLPCNFLFHVHFLLMCFWPDFYMVFLCPPDKFECQALMPGFAPILVVCFLTVGLGSVCLPGRDALSLSRSLSLFFFFFLPLFAVGRKHSHFT